MDQEIKARWIAKLRESDRKQGKLVLRTPEGAQCCLDVLCEIAVEDGIIPEPELRLDRYTYTVPPVDSDHEEEVVATVLPVKVMNWSGLSSCNPYVTADKHLEKYGERLRLSMLNDDLNQDFNRIADLIEGDETL